jgi:hypothetical protein
VLRGDTCSVSSFWIKPNMLFFFKKKQRERRRGLTSYAQSSSMGRSIGRLDWIPIEMKSMRVQDSMVYSEGLDTDEC